MAIVHVCIGCGLDLARVRPVRDAQLDLPVVTCPRCGWACVRRLHPLRRFARQSRRAARAAALLAIQLILVLGLAIGSVACARGIIETFFRTPLPLGRDEWVALALMGVLFPLIVGTWLEAGLPHWRRWAAWSAFALLALVLAGCASMVEAYQSVIWRNVGPGDWTASRLAYAWFAAEGALIRYLPGLAWIMLTSLAGIAPGRWTAGLIDSARRHLWRARRRRRRLARVAG